MILVPWRGDRICLGIDNLHTSKLGPAVVEFLVRKDLSVEPSIFVDFTQRGGDYSKEEKMHCWFTTSCATHPEFSTACSEITLLNDVTDVEMDHTLWSNLPDALVDRIAASLPLPSLFRFRTVCKRFESNMSRQSFLDHCEVVGKHAPYFLMLVERPFGMAGLTYSIVFQKWYNMPFPILSSLSKFDILASAGGLLFLKNREDSSLSVCNPLTHSSRELPSLHTTTRIAFEAGMVMDPNGKDYRIIMWKDEHTGPITKVYSSKTNQWVLKRSARISGDVLSDSGVMCGDHFYILVIHKSLSVFAYSLKEDTWQKLQASMPSDILYGYLISQWGTLLLVGGIGKNFPTKGIAVWRLDLSRNTWMPILSMPSNLFTALAVNFQRYDAFNCAGQGDHICFIADRHSKALIYDFRRKAWQWSPQFPSGSSPHLIAIEFSFSALV